MELTKSLVTREELLEKLKKVEHACDRFLILGIFEGMRGNFCSDFFSFHMCQFEDIGAAPDNHWVCLPGDRAIKVSDDLYDYAKEASDSDIVYTLSGNTENVSGEVHPFAISVVSDNYDDFNKIILTRLAKLRKKYGEPCFGLKALSESGRLNYIHEELGDKDITAYVADNHDDIMYVYGCFKNEKVTELYKEFYKVA